MTVATGISSDLTLGEVHLTVADLERSLAYYRSAIGLEVFEQDAARARLGTASGRLLELVEEPGARPAPGHTGLFHFALLLPEREDLARWLAHAGATGVELTGMSDHFVSEALYLRDPDGHGIEIYWDRPRHVWEGLVAERMTTQPLDVRSLLSELPESPEDYTGLPAGTDMGHVHLCVAEVAETVAFYRDVVGLAVMAEFGPQAAFLAAGGYHHHVGANTWESAGAAPPPPGSAALRHATLRLADGGDRDRLLERLAAAGRDVVPAEGGDLFRDPSGNGWVVG